MLMGPLAQVGLALATSIGAWINLTLVVWLGLRAGHIRIDARLRQSAIKLGVAGVAMVVVLWAIAAPLARLFAEMPGHDVITLLALAAIGGTLYAGVVLAIFGRRWLAAFKGRAR
ncbi:MAG: hypothetical protein B7X77_08515 [Caulobacter sp. 39-67-4]|nr:MAG: hypothetical protein B7X77_08515 [Caulobacter sp. 39-67-4]